MANPRNPFFGSQEIELVSNPSDNRPSALLAMIPGAVKHGFSRMPLLRRSISSYNVRARPTLKGKRPQSLDLGTFELRSERESSSLATSASTAVTAWPTCGPGTATGWKYATQGLSLLEAAVQEAQCSQTGDPALARQLYIHSLAYLLHGLPSDMSEAEAASLRPGITPILERGYIGCSNESSSSRSGTATAPSLLHRLLASGIIQLFILFSLILPYVKYFLQSAYRYERTNHISERVFATSMDTMDRVGRQGFGLAGSILNSGNGRMGSILAGICAWWIDGISGGIHDGVSAGMAMIGTHERISG